MSHQATCHYCNAIACEVYSFHSLVAQEKRIGFDYYDCQNCKTKYVVRFHENGKWKPIEKATQTLEEMHRDFKKHELELLKRSIKRHSESASADYSVVKPTRRTAMEDAQGGGISPPAPEIQESHGSPVSSLAKPVKKPLTGQVCKKTHTRIIKRKKEG